MRTKQPTPSARPAPSDQNEPMRDGRPESAPDYAGLVERAAEYLADRNHAHSIAADAIIRDLLTALRERSKT